MSLTPHPTAAPPIDSQIIYKHMEQFYNKRIIRSFRREKILESCSSRNQQIALFAKHMPQTYSISLSNKDLACIFQVNPCTVTKALQNSDVEEHNIGRPLKLEEDKEIDIVNYIKSSAEQGEPKTRKDIINYIHEELEIECSDGWFTYFLRRHPELIQKEAVPQEDKRLFIPKSEVSAHILNLMETLHNKYAELVFNVDEMGSSDWSDKKIKSVIVPSAFADIDVHYAVKRSSRKGTVVACISAAGDNLTPLIVQTNKKINKDVYKYGLRENEDVKILYSENGYITTELFKSWIEDIFIPYVNNVRSTLGMEYESAVLTTDNCSCHCNDVIKKLLADNNIILFTWPPHSSHLFQPLDLVIFSLVKRTKSTCRTKFNKGTQADYITKLIMAFESASTSINIRSAFRRAGMALNVEEKPYKIDINKDILLDSQKIFHYLIEDSTKSEVKRATTSFGFINKEFFINKK